MDVRTEQLVQRGREAFERKDYVAALADLREVLLRHPSFADIRHLAGLCLGFLGQPEAALQEFQRAIEVNEGYVEAHLNSAITLTELGRYDEAKLAFQRAGELEKVGGELPAAVTAKLANAHMEVGDLYVAANAYPQAVEQYEVALRLRPQFHDIRHKFARALLELNESGRAEIELRRVLEGNQYFLAARLELGLIHFRCGERELASEHWRRCQEQQPEHPQVRAYLALLDRDVVSQESVVGDV